MKDWIAIDPVMLRSACQLLLLGMLAVTVSASDQPPTTVWPEDFDATLDTLLHQLSETSDEVLIAKARMLAAEAEKGVAESAKLPTVGVELSSVLRNEYRQDDTGHSVSVTPVGGAFLRQSVYNWGAIEAGVKVAELREAIAEERVAEVERLTRNEVRRRYLNAQLAAFAIDLSRLQVEFRKQLLDRTQGQLAREAVGAEAVVEAEIALEEAEIDLERALLKRERQLDDLELVLGLSTNPEPMSDALLERAIALAEEADRQRFNSETISSEVSVKQKELAAAKAEKTVIEAATLPKVDLVGRLFVDQVESAGEDNVTRSGADLMLRVTWNIFDGFETRSRKLANLAEQRRLEREASQLTLIWRNRLNSQLREFPLLARQLLVAKRSVELEGRSLETSQLGFEKGVIARSELIEARIREMRARQKLYGAAAALVDAWVTLASATSIQAE